MKRLLIAVIGSALLGIASLSAAGVAQGAQNCVFNGTWTSTDTDGSHQALRVTGSGRGAFGMFYTDDSATGACGGDPARVVGAGRAQGDTLVMRGTLVCVPASAVLVRLRLEFAYSASADTLTDEFGITWRRA